MNNQTMETARSAAFRRRPPWTVLALGIWLIPQPAAAEWWDFIGEMSGPRLMGFGYSCKPLGPRPFRTVTDDEVVGMREAAEPVGLVGSLLTTDRCFRAERWSPTSGVDPSGATYWVRTEGTYYFERADHLADVNRSRSVKALVPGVVFEVSPEHPLHADNPVVMFAGVGLEMYTFFGTGFDPFVRFALKVRPAGVRFNLPGRWPALEASLNFRYFFSRITSEDFDLPLRSNEPIGGREWVMATSLSLVF